MTSSAGRETIGLYARFIGAAILFACVTYFSTGSMARPTRYPPVGGITFNQVIRLTRSGISDDSIIAQIKRRPHPFTLSPGEVDELRNAGVSDSVIDVMTRTPGNAPASEQPSAETGKVPVIQQAPTDRRQERYVAQPAAPPSPLTAPEANPGRGPATLAPQPSISVANKPTKSNDRKIRLRTPIGR